MATINYLTQSDRIVEQDGFMSVAFKRFADLLLDRTGGVKGGSYLPLTEAASIIWDVDNKPAAFLLLTGNRAMANPINMTPGRLYRVTVIQDATGGRTLTWGSAFKFPGGTAPTLSAPGNAVDELSFSCDGTNMKLVGFAGDLR